MYGDSAYADGATLDEQAQRGHDMRTKVPPVRNANGYSKDQFSIDLAAGTVTCPAHHTVAIRDGRRRLARFGALCQACPLRAAHPGPWCVSMTPFTGGSRPLGCWCGAIVSTSMSATSRAIRQLATMA